MKKLLFGAYSPYFDIFSLNKFSVSLEIKANFFCQLFSRFLLSFVFFCDIINKKIKELIACI